MLEKYEKKWNIQFMTKDTVLISYPKSGRTWLRMILATILDLSGEDVSKYEMLPAFHYTPKEMVSYIGKGAKIVFLHRDPGDVMMSLYASMKSSGKYDARLGVFYRGGVSSFIRGNAFYLDEPGRTLSGWESDGYGLKKAIHYNNTWKRQLTVFKDFISIKYEELHNNGHQVIKEVTDWLGFDYDDEIITKAIELSNLENMKKIENGEGRNNLAHYKGNFGKFQYSKGRVRQGKMQTYLEELCEEDREYVLEMKKRSLW